MSRSIQFVLVASLVVFARAASANPGGDSCTIDANGCNPDVAFSCDDGDDSTADSCNFEGVCFHCPAPQALAPAAPTCASDNDCDDANPCTSDVCDGECYHEPLTGTSCDDEFFCSLGDMCNLGVCEPGARATCPAAGTTCAPLVCSETERQCVNAPANEGVACDDGNSCTAADSCDGTGGCAGNRLPLCRNDLTGPAQSTVGAGNLLPAPMASALTDQPGDIEQVAQVNLHSGETYGSPDGTAGCDTGAGKRTSSAGIALVLAAFAIIILKRRAAAVRR